MSSDGFFEKVYAVAMQIPHGRVTSYGAIARYLGASGSARMVGWAMNASGKKEDVPAPEMRSPCVECAKHKRDYGELENLRLTQDKQHERAIHEREVEYEEKEKALLSRQKALEEKIEHFQAVQDEICNRMESVVPEHLSRVSRGPGPVNSDYLIDLVRSIEEVTRQQIGMIARNEEKLITPSAMDLKDRDLGVSPISGFARGDSRIVSLFPRK